MQGWNEASGGAAVSGLLIPVEEINSTHITADKCLIGVRKGEFQFPSWPRICLKGGYCILGGWQGDYQAK